MDDRLLLTGEPAQLVVGAARLRTAGWAGPWPVAERGWDAERALRERIRVLQDEVRAVEGG